MKKIDVVGAVIQNERQEILVALRSQSMSLPGYWEFPGGKVEPGEEPQETLRREIKEELDCDIEVGDLLADAVHAYPTVAVRLMTYQARVVGGTPVAKEHEKLDWLPLSALEALGWAPADLPTVDVLLGKTVPRP